MDNIENELHHCELPKNKDYKASRFGAAITECYQEEKDGVLWVGNGEYDNVVKFCPFCGYTVNK